MIKSLAVFYLTLCLLLMGVGYKMFKNMNDLSNPNSIGSILKKSQELVDENP